MTAIPIEDLTAEERLAMIAALWDSLEPTDLPLSQAQRGELDRRLATADADLGESRPWPEVVKRLKGGMA